jgi:NADPH:quinone reductase-like Zn-dependent oxidoreductase
MESQMKAVVRTRYGSVDVLQIREVARPVPRDNEALVRVLATSLNAADLEALRGTLAVRIGAPVRPAHRTLGTDVAGQVEAVGRNVKRFRPGDEIWGDLSFPLGGGAWAESVCIPEAALRLKPASLTFEQAAAVPTAAVVALQKLRHGELSRPGHKVLINGAGGGVGTFAVQLAKHFGAEVTAVDSTGKLDMLRAIGADRVIDYTQEDFTESGQRFDLILDVVAHRPVSAYMRALTATGVFVPVGGSMAVVSQAVLVGPLYSLIGGKRTSIGIWRPNSSEDLALLAELLDARKVVPVIDRCYPLSEVPEALRRLEAGHVKGKAVITAGQTSRA